MEPLSVLRKREAGHSWPNLIRLCAAVQALSMDSKLQTYYGQKNMDRQGGRWLGKIRDHPQEENMYHEEEQTAPDLQIRPSWWKGTLPGTHNPINMWPWRKSHML